MVARSIRIGSMEVERRIAMPPIATYKCDEDGHVTPEVLDYYAARASNPHVGLVITEHSFFTQVGKARQRQMAVCDDGCLSGLMKLTDAIHSNGAKAVAQLNHAGAATTHDITGLDPVAPSPIVLPVNPRMGEDREPHQLSVDEIAQIVEEYACAAARVKAAGYDGVEIHSAHAYLLNEFYSPLTNTRCDEYGGGVDGRIRIHREVIRAVRNAVGERFPVLVRLGALDYVPGGSTLEDAAFAARAFEEEGVDAVDVSGGMCRYTREGHTEPGYFKDASLAIREAVSIPVILTGGVKTLSQAQELLDGSFCDLVGIGRELMRDARWECACE